MKYTKQDFIAAIRACGIVPGDLVMVHTGMSSLRAMPEGVRSQDELSAFCMAGLLEAIGSTGTLIVPSFTYSLGAGDVYDARTTPTKGIGEFPSFFWKQPGVVRSDDPFLAVAGIGPRAAELFREGAPTSYGPGSFFDRFVAAGGKLLTIGVGMRWATIRYHFVEMAGAPFRYRKVFIGERVVDGKRVPCRWEYSVAPWAEKVDRISRQMGFVMEERLARDGLLSKAPLGRGFVYSIGAKEYRDYTVALLQREPWVSGEGIASIDAMVAEENARTGVAAYEIDAHAPLASFCAALEKLPRYLVSDGYDAALAAIAQRIPLTIHRYPTGTPCGEALVHFDGMPVGVGLVPERWLCRRAELRKMDGTLVFSAADDGHHVVAYSKSFHGMVSREELRAHLTVGAETVPFVSREESRRWGLACTQAQADVLTDEQYEVTIDTDFAYGLLKIGEYVPASCDKTQAPLIVELGATEKNQGRLVGLADVLANIEAGNEQRRVLFVPAQRFAALVAEQGKEV